MRTANALLDYRFGWRWLLPSIVGRKVKLYGFSIEEELFWHDTLGDVIWSFAPHETEVVIVNGFARPNSVDQVDSMHMQNAQLVCVISSRGQYGHWYRQLCQQFSMVREYGLLPSGNPRVVVPLSSSNNVIAALSLHRPGRKIAQLALVVARLLAMLGNFTLLRGCTLMIASRSAKLMPSSLLDSNLFTIIRSGKTSDYALYLGTADDNRKTVVLPVGKSPSAFILKVSVTTKASASLKNEASALSILADSVLSTSVPRVQQIILSSSYDVTICQEYRPRKRTSHSMLNCEVVRFLGQLMFLQHKLVPLSDWLQTSRAGSNRVKNDSSIVSGACSTLYARIQLLSESGAQILLHRTHGDFAPWNCAWTSSGLFVFDWEDSQENGLALGDAFYYIIAPALLLQRRANIVKTLHRVLLFADRVVCESGLELDSRLYLVLWLLERFEQDEFYSKLLVQLEQSW